MVAGNSVLTEHVLIPRVAKDAKGKDDSNARTGPDDAPIEVDTVPRLCWNLLRLVVSTEDGTVLSLCCVYAMLSSVSAVQVCVCVCVCARACTCVCLPAVLCMYIPLYRLVVCT